MTKFKTEEFLNKYTLLNIYTDSIYIDKPLPDNILGHLKLEYIFDKLYS
jgi:hypothetical protein